MKKCIAFLAAGVLGIAQMLFTAGCGQNWEPVIELCGDSVGAYFITDASYERFVRSCAEEVGADEQWISDVLNGGDGGEWHYLVRPKSWFWCAIADNMITVSEIYDTVYDISVDGDAYKGISIINTVSFWFEYDILYMNDNGETTEYKKDNSYKRTQGKPIALDAPDNIETVVGGNGYEEGYDYVNFQWYYRSGYGSIGAAAEIKRPGSAEYEAFAKIDRVYMNSIVVQLFKPKFGVGVNTVRIYHIGGPSITRDKSIIVNSNSPYVSYRVTVYDNGIMKFN